MLIFGLRCCYYYFYTKLFKSSNWPSVLALGPALANRLDDTAWLWAVHKNKDNVIQISMSTSGLKVEVYHRALLCNVFDTVDKGLSGVKHVIITTAGRNCNNVNRFARTRHF